MNSRGEIKMAQSFLQMKRDRIMGILGRLKCTEIKEVSSDMFFFHVTFRTDTGVFASVMHQNTETDPRKPGRTWLETWAYKKNESTVRSVDSSTDEEFVRSFVWFTRELEKTSGEERSA